VFAVQVGSCLQFVQKILSATVLEQHQAKTKKKRTETHGHSAQEELRAVGIRPPKTVETKDGCFGKKKRHLATFTDFGAYHVVHIFTAEAEAQTLHWPSIRCPDQCACA